MFPELPKDTMLYTNDGSRYFETARVIERTLAGIHNDPKRVIFHLKGIFSVDGYNLELFRDLITNYKKRGVSIYLCEAVPGVKQKLENTGIVNLIDGQFFDTLDEVLKKVSLIQRRDKNRTLKRLILILLPFKHAYKLIKLIRRTILYGSKHHQKSGR